MSILNNCIIPDWPAPARVKALQTTRQGGVSLASYGSLNLGSHVGDNPLAVALNRVLLNRFLPGEPLWLEQVHGTVVASADREGCLPQNSSEPGGAGMNMPPSTLSGHHASHALRADASIARRRAAVCVVMTADCLPVLLCDVSGSVVGAVHAGWRGLAAGVIDAAVEAMDTAPHNLMAWLGPAISQDAFEVGEEVRAAFLLNDPRSSSAFVPGASGKWFADIYALARLRLNSLGIRQIYGGGHCTYREHEKFYSYRREPVAGRMGTFIWLE